MFTWVYLLLVGSVVYTEGRIRNNVFTPLHIKVYYETLCPGSIEFIVNQLVPTYNDKKFNYAGLMINMDLIPYGHVYNPDFAKYNYTCQHGVPECEGNKLHGCAIKYIEDKGILLNYISCLMNITKNADKPISSYPANECKSLVPGEKMDKISKCYNSTEGWDLFNQHGMATETFFGPNRFFVPYVSFDDEKNDYVASSAAENFRTKLCIQNGVINCAFL